MRKIQLQQEFLIEKNKIAEFEDESISEKAIPRAEFADEMV